jgi:diguanylate cyclase (GGDEF)-like protein
MRPTRTLAILALIAVTLLIAGLAIQRTLAFHAAAVIKAQTATVIDDRIQLAVLAERHALELLALFGAGMVIAGFITVKSVSICLAWYGRGEGINWTDPATGFPSRERLLQFVFVEILRAQRYKVPFSVAVFVPDRLERLPRRDRSALLIELGKFVADNVRNIDAVFSLGNGRFALLLPHTGLSGGFIVGERLRLKVAGHELCKGCKAGPVRITASFGIAEADAQRDQPNTLIARAEACMEQAIAGGGNRVC